MKRLTKISTSLMTACLLMTSVPTDRVQAQVAPDAPVTYTVDILLQVNNKQPKRQENASFQILKADTLEVVYTHKSDKEVEGSLNLAPGKYLLRLFDGQDFKRNEKQLEAGKVEQSIASRNDQEVANNKKMKTLENKGDIHLANDGNLYYELEFTVEKGPDLQNADHSKLEAKLSVLLTDDVAAQPTTDQAAGVTNPTPAPETGAVQITVISEGGKVVQGAVV